MRQVGWILGLLLVSSGSAEAALVVYTGAGWGSLQDDVPARSEFIVGSMDLNGHHQVTSSLWQRLTHPDQVVPSDITLPFYAVTFVGDGRSEHDWLNFGVEESLKVARWADDGNSSPASRPDLWVKQQGEPLPTSAAPEPGTMFLVGSGLVGMAWKQRRRRLG